MAARCSGERAPALDRVAVSGAAALLGGLGLNRRLCLANGVVLGCDQGSGGVRFVLIIMVIVLAVLAGLYVYGQMLEPQTHTIEVEALDGQ